MTIEIIGACIQDGNILITAVDCSEENYRRLERLRDDVNQKEFEFVFDTKDKKAYFSIRRWLLKQSCIKGKKTWGEVIHSLVGTITDSKGIGCYRVRDI